LIEYVNIGEFAGVPTRVKTASQPGTQDTGIIADEVIVGDGSNTKVVIAVPDYCLHKHYY